MVSPGGETSMLTNKYGVAALIVAGAGIVAGAVAFSPSSVPEDATYVGPDKCRLCHMEEYKMWKEVGHATAFGDLLPEEQKDPDCFKCHVTGHGEESGYTSADETPELKNVSCEACHGPGSAHVKIAGEHMGQAGDWPMKLEGVPQNRCVKCHNEHINFAKRAEKLRNE